MEAEAEMEMEMGAERKRERGMESEVIEKSGGGAPREEEDAMETKRRRDDDNNGDDDDYDERQPLCSLAKYQGHWMYLYSKIHGGLEDETAIPSMLYTDGPVHFAARPMQALQMFSVRVTEILRGLEWPLRVYGFIALRDSVDHKRNYIFKRERTDCQTLLNAQDSSLVLTGPSRAVMLLDPIEFEVDLKVEGKRKSEDKVLSAIGFDYNCIVGEPGCARTVTEIDRCSTLEFKFAHLASAVEATIKVSVVGGPIDFGGQFFAQTSSFLDEKVMLLDSRDGVVAVDADGAIKFSRSVVVVSLVEKLIVGVNAYQGNRKTSAAADSKVELPPGRNSRSYETFDVGFCKMTVEVAWSLLNPVFY